MKEVNPETFTTDISDMNKRKAFAMLKDFVLGDECYQGKILAVYGLKRTGKTTLLKQLLCDIDAYTASCAFLEMQDSDTMKMLERRIEEVLRKKLGGIINGTLLLCPSRTDRVECGK